MTGLPGGRAAGRCRAPERAGRRRPFRRGRSDGGRNPAAGPRREGRPAAGGGWPATLLFFLGALAVLASETRAAEPPPTSALDAPRQGKAAPTSGTAGAPAERPRAALRSAPPCPMALLREMLGAAAEGGGVVSALAIEREALILCARREEAAKRVLELESELRAFLPRPEVPAPAARPAHAAPDYGWFSILGSGDRLRAAVTDGRRNWFVRAGDRLPGGARIGAVRPSGVSLSGGGLLPYRAPPGRAP